MDLPSFLQPSTPETRFLYALRRGKARLGLQTTRRLLRALGSPERDMPIIQVAGTNGKGSTTALCASILQASRLRVGRFTSPHLLQVEERISVDGLHIDSDTFARRVRDIRGHIERSGASFFEAMTGLAALHFRDVGVDAAVFEVGLGGRLDSTTALPANVTAIASIGHDHEAILGHGVTAICDEKLGIVRPGVPLHVAIEQADLVQRAREHCARLGAPFHPLPVDVARVLELDLWSGMLLELTYPAPLRVWTRLLGRHQARNTALAVAATQDLAAALGRSSGLDIEAGCAHAFMPGRFQVLEPIANEPVFILDVAHNPESLHATLDVAEHVLRGRRVAIVLGMLSDKRFDGVVPRMPEVSRELVLTLPTNERAWDLRGAEAEVRAMPEAAGLRVTAIADVRAALEAACAAAPEVVLVLGSQYLLGEVVPILAEWRRVTPQALVSAPRFLDENHRAVS